jgi:hypothetical protein
MGICWPTASTNSSEPPGVPVRPTAAWACRYIGVASDSASRHLQQLARRLHGRSLERQGSSAAERSYWKHIHAGGGSRWEPLNRLLHRRLPPAACSRPHGVAPLASLPPGRSWPAGRAAACWVRYRSWVGEMTRPPASAPMRQNSPTGETWPSHDGWKRAPVYLQRGKGGAELCMSAGLVACASWAARGLALAPSRVAGNRCMATGGGGGAHAPWPKTSMPAQRHPTASQTSPV